MTESLFFREVLVANVSMERDVFLSFSVFLLRFLCIQQGKGNRVPLKKWNLILKHFVWDKFVNHYGDLGMLRWDSAGPPD